MTTDTELAEFIRKMRDAGVKGDDIATQLGCSRSKYETEVRRLQKLSLDCGQARSLGAPRKEMKLPEVPAK